MMYPSSLAALRASAEQLLRLCRAVSGSLCLRGELRVVCRSRVSLLPRRRCGLPRRLCLKRLSVLQTSRRTSAREDRHVQTGARGTCRDPGSRAVGRQCGSVVALTPERRVCHRGPQLDSCVILSKCCRGVCHRCRKACRSSAPPWGVSAGPRAKAVLAGAVVWTPAVGTAGRVWFWDQVQT